MIHPLRRRPASFVALATLAAVMAAQPAIAGDLQNSAADPLGTVALDIPATPMVLPNGLTLIVNEDHSVPLVALSIWFHVGSKNEPKGKTGFAHLFEHLMFTGSEHFRDNFQRATQKLGATEQNGTTNQDRTTYFETVPTGALDSLLWLESDRMGHLLGSIDQKRLDDQRAVVKNEKRQGQNQPYASSSDLVIRATQPVGHPYDHSTIGSMEDLDAASLDDVKSWFRTYYGASNAVLVLSGDITPAEARAKVETYFGDIAPGQPVAHPRAWVAKMGTTVRETTSVRAAQPRLIMTWNVPGYGTTDMTDLDIMGDLLAGSRGARLYRRLVLGDQLATRVDAGTDGGEIEGQFQIDVTLKPGGDTARVERIVREEMARLIVHGATPEEMTRVRIRYEAGQARDLQDPANRADLLAQSQSYLGSPDGWKTILSRRRTATSADIQRAGREWLSSGDYVLAMQPFGDLKSASTGADRSSVPVPSAIASAIFPDVERATLSNGLKLVVAHRGGMPLITLTMLVDTGVPADYAEIPAGTSTVATKLLQEGTISHTGPELADSLDSLGAQLSVGGDAETGQVNLSVLKPVLGRALPLFADVVMNPAFRPADVERIKADTETTIRSQRQSSSQVASRLLPRFVYGVGSPYGRLATEASIASINRATVEAFHNRWFHPNNATLIVSGDTSLAEIRPPIEAALSGWKAAPVPVTIEPAAAPATRATVYLIDMPGAPQSVVDAALLAPPRKQGDEMPRRLFNTAFGGVFLSRVNMKLREEKGWSYGAHSSISGGRGPRMFITGGPVQSDRTVDSLHEIDFLLKDVVTVRPLDEKELASAKDNLSLGLTDAWSTADGVSEYLSAQVSEQLPDDYFDHYTQKIAAGTLSAANAAGASLIEGHPLTWIVVGDRAKVEDKLRALNLGDLKIVDADGNPVS